MIPRLRCIVQNRPVGFEHDLFERHLLERRTRDQFVEVVHVGLMMLAVVVLDGLFAHVWSESVLRVGELGYYMCHNQ